MTGPPFQGSDAKGAGKDVPSGFPEAIPSLPSVAPRRQQVGKSGAPSPIMVSTHASLPHPQVCHVFRPHRLPVDTSLRTRGSDHPLLPPEEQGRGSSDLHILGCSCLMTIRRANEGSKNWAQGLPQQSSGRNSILARGRVPPTGCSRSQKSEAWPGPRAGC